MSQKEYQTISDFINGNMNEKERKKISDSIKDFNSNTMNTEKTKQFNAEKAWDKLHNRIQNESGHSLKIRRIYNMRIAASILVFFAISSIAYVIFNTVNQNRFVEVQSGKEIKEILLADGSFVTLNTNSTLKYPKKFSGKNRTVDFTGEAFFQITKNPNRPFIVKSGEAKIKVLGTSFNVQNKNNTTISVYVETGMVQLSGKDDNSITLTPGEEGKLENNKLTEDVNPDKNISSWKTKRFIYNDELLSKVILDFNKAYHTNIVLKNEEIGIKRITTQELNEKSLNSALTIICKTLNLEFKTETDQIIISEINE
jgi:ferric-dicitrate binding protein FerR (iron transport regulator)